MGRTVETAAVETKSSLPLLTTYRPLRFTWPVRPGSLSGPGVARGMKKIGFFLMSSGRQDESMATDALTLERAWTPTISASLDVACARARQAGDTGFRRVLIRPA